jgi:hypothetical protein
VPVEAEAGALKAARMTLGVAMLPVKAAAMRLKQRRCGPDVETLALRVATLARKGACAPIQTTTNSVATHVRQHPVCEM